MCGAGVVVLSALAVREARALGAEVAIERRLPAVVGQGVPFALRIVVRAARLPEGTRVEWHRDWPAELVPLTLREQPRERFEGEDEEDGLGVRAWRPMVPAERAAGLTAEWAGDELAFSVQARALRRGYVAPGQERVWLVGRFVQRALDVDAARTRLRVEPPMLALRRTLELVTSERIFDLGAKQLRFAPRGQTEFESLRDYVPGDEPRRMDWKAYARRGRPMVRQYEPERGQEVIVLIDRGRRMGVTVDTEPELSKFDRALDGALMFIAGVLAQRDRVGVLVFDDDLVKWVAPGVSARQFGRIREAIFDLAPSSAESNLGAALERLGTLHRRRALVVVLTDLPDPAAWQREAAALRLATRHRVVYAALNDPALVACAEGAPDPQSGAAPDALERAAATWLLEERATGLASLEGLARTLDLPATDAVPELLTAWFTERRRL